MSDSVYRPPGASYAWNITPDSAEEIRGLPSALRRVSNGWEWRFLPSGPWRSLSNSSSPIAHSVVAEIERRWPLAGRSTEYQAAYKAEVERRFDWPAFQPKYVYRNALTREVQLPAPQESTQALVQHFDPALERVPADEDLVRALKESKRDVRLWSWLASSTSALLALDALLHLIF